MAHADGSVQVDVQQRADRSRRLTAQVTDKAGGCVQDGAVKRGNLVLSQPGVHLLCAFCLRQIALAIGGRAKQCVVQFMQGLAANQDQPISLCVMESCKLQANAIGGACDEYIHVCYCTLVRVGRQTVVRMQALWYDGLHCVY
jgi:hypothetical protein